jgi:hypothetical protein
LVLFVWYLHTVWCTFLIFFVLLVSGHHNLDAANFGNLQDPQEQDFEQQHAGEQGKCFLDHVDPIFFLSVY